MPKVKHPTIPDTVREVSDDDLAAWVEQGWQPADPTPQTPTADDEAEGDQTPRSATTRRK